MTSLLSTAARALLILLAGTSAVRAQVVYDVHVNTSALVGNSAGPFYLDFQLNDGSGVGNGNNTASIGSFDFQGGAALADLALFGGATGSLNSTVTLTDTSFLNEFFQAFTPGPSLSFQLTLTTNADAPASDLFVFSILDGSLLSLPTFAPSSAFVVVSLAGSTTVPQTFAGDAAAIGGIALPAPTVSAPSAVPEPSTYGVFAAVALIALVGSRRRTTTHRSALVAR